MINSSVEDIEIEIEIEIEFEKRNRIRNAETGRKGKETKPQEKQNMYHLSLPLSSERFDVSVRSGEGQPWTDSTCQIQVLKLSILLLGLKCECNLAEDRGRQQE